MVFSQRFVRTGIAALQRWKRKHGYTLVGTSPSASHDYHAITYRYPTLLLMGEERKGLPPELQSLCDVMVRIPMVGEADSLNLAIATGVMLYEFYKSAALPEQGSNHKREWRLILRLPIAI